MAKAPTKKQRLRWERLRELGCSVCGTFPVEIHHCETGMGGRKDHDKVIPLCVSHHTGSMGIHTGRKQWREFYGTEQEHMSKVEAV